MENSCPEEDFTGQPEPQCQLPPRAPYHPFKSRKILTLAFIEKKAEVLLGFKKRGFGSGLWNGFGGKVEEGETILEAASREIREESGLVVLPEDLTPSAVLHFPFLGEDNVLEVHVFRTSKFSGEVSESEEMSPKWWRKGKVPFAQMWPDDEIWFKYFLSDQYFTGIFLFQGLKVIQAYKITTSSGLELEKVESATFDIEQIWEDVKTLPILPFRGYGQGNGKLEDGEGKENQNLI